jgi:hypothetical protein
LFAGEGVEAASIPLGRDLNLGDARSEETKMCFSSIAKPEM